MDTIQIIKINQNQILVTLNTNKTIKLDVKFDNLKNIIRKINYQLSLSVVVALGLTQVLLMIFMKLHLLFQQ